jgi:hypothetical protein
MADTPVRIGEQATRKLNSLQEILGITKKTILEKLIYSVNIEKVKRERRLQ